MGGLHQRVGVPSPGDGNEVFQRWVAIERRTGFASRYFFAAFDNCNRCRVLGESKMGNKNFVILCLRLLGIYFFVLGLSALPGVVSMFLRAFHAESYYFMGPLIYLIAGTILFVSAPRISHFIIEFSGADEDGYHISVTEQTARIAFIILGIFIFAQALPQIIQLAMDIGVYYARIDEIPGHLRSQQQRWTILIGPAVKLIIGVVLIIGPDKIMGVIARYDESFKK